VVLQHRDEVERWWCDLLVDILRSAVLGAASNDAAIVRAELGFSGSRKT
jgi:hypothetical protein